ncbi:hypothetical protein FB451DRAFT_1189730 [Mycena latifolia]|nr:hypothetical protein FB451DRAFT_1189730 [Mycena latifolia]
MSPFSWLEPGTPLAHYLRCLFRYKIHSLALTPPGRRAVDTRHYISKPPERRLRTVPEHDFLRISTSKSQNHPLRPTYPALNLNFYRLPRCFDTICCCARRSRRWEKKRRVGALRTELTGAVDEDCGLQERYRSAEHTHGRGRRGLLREKEAWAVERTTSGCEEERAQMYEGVHGEEERRKLHGTTQSCCAHIRACPAGN